MKPSPLTKLRTRIANWIAPGPQPLASVSARVDDSAGWQSHNKAGPADRPWVDRAQDLDDVFTAWQKNFLVRRIVTLARSYIVGSGITITSDDPSANKFIQDFWTHPKNQMENRIAPMINELIRAGEIFPTLHTNRSTGMSYVRFIPAAQIREIRTADNDYETELQYGEIQQHTTELKWWVGPGHRHALGRQRGGVFTPLMLHYSINKEIGCTRGEGDLGPLLPWAKRYTGWLQDRVRMNRVRTRQGILDIEIADDSMVQQKKHQLTRDNPLEAGVYVHGPGETVKMEGLRIDASNAEDDGKALRLACATSANVGLHYLGEGETVNYATAKEMGEPTSRYYSERQRDFIFALQDLITVAYHRYCVLGFATWPDDEDLHLETSVAEVAKADNESLARSASFIVRALVEMANQGWVDDETAADLAFRFAGEPLGADDIAAILQKASRGGSRTAQDAESTPDDENNDLQNEDSGT